MSAIDAAFYGSATRSIGWYVDVLTETDVLKLERVPVESHDLDWNVFRDVHGGGAITLRFAHDDPRLQQIVWLRDRFRPRMVTQVGADRRMTYWGVYLASGDVEIREDERGTLVSLQLVDKLEVVRGEQLAYHYTAAANALATSAARSLLLGTGERRQFLPDLSNRLRTAMAYPAGTTRLTIINALLTSAGCSALMMDRNGAYRSGRYVEPEHRPVVWDFSRDETSIALPGRVSTLNASDVPNRVVCVSTESEDTPALVSYADNRSPFSIYSYESRGRRWVSDYEEGVEVTTQALLDEYAARKLRTAGRVALRTPVTHLPIPLWLNDAVIAPDGRKMTVVEMKLQASDSHAMMETVLRRFEEV